MSASVKMRHEQHNLLLSLATCMPPGLPSQKSLLHFSNEQQSHTAHTNHGTNSGNACACCGKVLETEPVFAQHSAQAVVILWKPMETKSRMSAQAVETWKSSGTQWKPKAARKDFHSLWNTCGNHFGWFPHDFHRLWKPVEILWKPRCKQRAIVT